MKFLKSQTILSYFSLCETHLSFCLMAFQAPIRQRVRLGRQRKATVTVEVLHAFLFKVKALFYFLIWIVQRYFIHHHVTDHIVDKPLSGVKRRRMYQISDSGNQSAANSDELSSNASSSDLPHSNAHFRLQNNNNFKRTNLNAQTCQDDLAATFRCLNRGLKEQAQSTLIYGEQAAPTTPCRFTLRPSSSLNQLNDQKAMENSPSAFPPLPSTAKTASSRNLSVHDGGKNRTLGEMEREMSEMQKTIVDLRLRLELYYEQYNGKFANMTDVEVRKFALEMENENKDLKQRCEQLEQDLQKSLETYPQLVSELNNARAKLAEKSNFTNNLVNSSAMTDFDEQFLCCSLKQDGCQICNQDKEHLQGIIEKLKQHEAVSCYPIVFLAFFNVFVLIKGATRRNFQFED